MGSAVRRDQARNRQELISAAVSGVLEEGSDISLGAVARRARLGPSTLYRHFSTREDLLEAVLDALIAPVLARATQAVSFADPAEAFRFVLAESCAMSEAESRAFARIAASGDRLGAYAHRLIEGVVEPVTRRAQASGCLYPGLGTADIALFVRMADVADSIEQRRTAVETLLRGILV
ncbi:TetR/AcrR family transcriptional regulator [Streptomyces gramineus]|uniref:TetR/AcrR family transcriptional regulator n=1 Tax=Streptomyces gramineus TaxID=910542 RepID=UPI00398B1448